jgi:hypothetical protein
VLNQSDADWYKVLLVVDGADGVQEKKYGYVPASYLLIEDPMKISDEVRLMTLVSESQPEAQPKPEPGVEPQAEPEAESGVV